MSGRSKFWIDDKMYLVDDEVYNYFEQFEDKSQAVLKQHKKLQAENKRLKEKITQLQRQYDDAIIAQVERNKKGNK